MVERDDQKETESAATGRPDQGVQDTAPPDVREAEYQTHQSFDYREFDQQATEAAAIATVLFEAVLHEGVNDDV